MPSSRDYRIDGVKLFLIVLVTIGHAIEPARSNPYAHKLYSVIYLFHMPLFVLISGYFASITTKEKLLSKVKMLLETYLVVMIPQCIAFRSYHPLLNPENSGWYLFSLLSWYVVVYQIDKNKILSKIGGGKWLIISSLVLSIAAFLLPLRQYGNLFSFTRTLMFLPFFIFGYILHQNNKALICTIRPIYKWGLMGLSMIAFIACCLYSSRILHVLEFNNANVWYMSELYDANVSDLLLLKILVFVGSIISSLFILQFVKLPQCLCKYGSRTLAFYVIQGIFAHVLGAYLQPNFINAILLGIVILITSALLLKYVDAKYITNPITSLIKWKS